MKKILKAADTVIAAILALNIFSHTVTVIVYLLMFIDSSVKYNEVLDMAIGAVIWYSVFISVFVTAIITVLSPCIGIIKYMGKQTVSRKNVTVFLSLYTVSLVLWAAAFFLAAFWSV